MASFHKPLVSSPTPIPCPVTGPGRRWWMHSRMMLMGMVLLMAVLAGWYQYHSFLDVHRHLWDNSTHDRNAHYLYSLKLANAIREGNLYQLADLLNSARVWPPLHGVLGACAMLVGGMDYRLAVLPSLVGYVGLIVFAFLLGWRMVPRGSTLAGLTAVLFVVVSPPYRAFATDIMLESLGACLTLVALYCYMLASQSRPMDRWTGRCLGLALTLLFLEKYNYWFLVVFALLASEVLTHPGTCWRLGRSTLAAVNWRAWGRAQLRHPLTWVFALLVGLTIVVFIRGPYPLTVAGYQLNIYPPHNIVHAAYVVLFLRMVSWWRNGVGAWVKERFDGRLRMVILWHVIPLTIWFLLPKRPSLFFWYISPNNANSSQHFDLVAGLSQYCEWAITHYHTSLFAAVLAGVLCLVGLRYWHRLRVGGRAVLILFLVAGCLTVIHPNRKSRNLHSYLATGWVLAGVGAASLIYGRRTRRWAAYRRYLAGGTVVGLGVLLLPALFRPAHAPEGGPHPTRASMLDLTDFYLEELAGTRSTILAAVPVKPLTQWTYLQRYGQCDPLEEHWYGFGPAGEANRTGFRNWLKTTNCEKLVFFDRTPPGKTFWEPIPETALHAELRDLVFKQDAFELVKERSFPVHGCRILIWQRKQ